MASTNQSSSPITTDESKRLTQLAIATATVEGVKSMYAKRQRGFDWVWNNPYGLTPQQVFDSYGALALGICLDDQEAIAFINKRCLLPDGTDDPKLAAYKITQGAPTDYELTFGMNGSTPTGFVTAKPKLYVTTLPGATVTLSDGQTATADASRVVTFAAVEGDYTGTASLAGHDDATFSVSLARGGQKATADPVLITGLLTITGPVNAVVTVTPTSGDPVNLTLDPTDADPTQGSSAIKLIPGNYTITSVLDGYTDTPVTVNLTRDGLTVACGLITNTQ